MGAHVGKSDTRKKLKADDPEQSQRFIETAKAVEADDTREGADRAFKRVAQKQKQKRA